MRSACGSGMSRPQASGADRCHGQWSEARQRRRALRRTCSPTVRPGHRVRPCGRRWAWHSPQWLCAARAEGPVVGHGRHARFDDVRQPTWRQDQLSARRRSCRPLRGAGTRHAWLGCRLGRLLDAAAGGRQCRRPGSARVWCHRPWRCSPQPGSAGCSGHCAIADRSTPGRVVGPFIGRADRRLGGCPTGSGTVGALRG